MKRAWFQRIRDGGGMSNHGLWGKNPFVATFFCFAIFPCQPLYCFTQPPSWRMAAGGWGSYCLWEWGGMTVIPLPTRPLHPRLHSLHSPTAMHPHGCRFVLSFWSGHPRAEGCLSIFLTKRSVLLILTEDLVYLCLTQRRVRLPLVHRWSVHPRA